MTTTTPGMTAHHAIITPTCRENRGIDGAINEALMRIRAEYLLCQVPENDGAKFHVVLTVEPPEVA